METCCDDVIVHIFAMGGWSPHVRRVSTLFRDLYDVHAPTRIVVSHRTIDHEMYITHPMPRWLGHHWRSTRFPDPNFYRYIHTLELENTQITDFTQLRHFHTVKLMMCTQKSPYRIGATMDVWLHEIDDVSLVPAVEHFEIKSNQLRDLSPLRSMRSLAFRYCTRLHDASALHAVPTLAFYGCPLYDVSALRHVRKLTLHFCVEVCDVSALGNVKWLDLTGCRQVRNVSALGNVKWLDLTGCRQVCDVSALSNVECLILNWCELVTDVSHLGRQRKLHLRGCPVRDVSMLSRVPDLDLRYCKELKDVSAVPHAIVE